MGIYPGDGLPLAAHSRFPALPTSTPDPFSSPNPEPEAIPSSDITRWFADEVRPHESHLKRWLKSKCPWLPDVDDVVQEALLRLWKRKQRRDAAPIRSPRSALFAIAHNAAIDLQRHAAVRKTDPVADIDGLRVLDGGAGVTESVAAREELEFLAAAFQKLPDRCRQVMTLTKIYGLTEREVGERLGLADSTVRTHIVRGLKHCGDYLREHGIERGSR